MSLDTQLSGLVINKGLTKEQFEEAVANGLIGENDISFVDENNEGGSLVLDTEMSDTSENGVQNKVIKEYVDNVNNTASYAYNLANVIADQTTYGRVKIGDNILCKDGVISATKYEAGNNVTFEEKIEEVVDIAKYYTSYTGELYENDNGNLTVLKDLGINGSYLRPTRAFGESYSIIDLTDTTLMTLSEIRIRFKLTNLPIADDTFSSFFGGAYSTFPKTNIKINYVASTDTLTFTQEYYNESNASFVIQNIYTISEASSKLLNQWATFILYKEDGNWKINVDNLGELSSTENAHIALGVNGWNYMFICNAYGANHNQTAETQYFNYDIDLSTTGIFNSDGVVLGFSEAKQTGVIISAVGGGSEGGLQNTATGPNGLAIFTSKTNDSQETVAVGYDSLASGHRSTAIGYNTLSSGAGGVSVGFNSRATQINAVGIAGAATNAGAIILGYGHNNEENTFKVALNSTTTRATDESTGLFTMLTADGKIPNGRLKISTTISSESTDEEPISAKAVYDAIGNIEELLAQL